MRAARRFPTNRRRLKFARTHADDVDAWLMSYADMITLLFMFFVIIVSVSNTRLRKEITPDPTNVGKQLTEERHGFVKIGSDFDEAFPELTGIIMANNADQDVAIEKTTNALSLDLSALHFFASGSADISEDGLPILRAMAKGLLKTIRPTDQIEVGGYTDNTPIHSNQFANNWELSSMRAARIAALLAAEGINPAQLHAASYAGNHPLVPNQDAKGAAITLNQRRNQRVMVIVKRPLPSDG